MTLALLDMRPITALSATEKSALPVSIVLDSKGNPFVVSRFGDSVWDFYPYIPHENKGNAEKRINWAIRLLDGSLLTDPQHAELLTSAKDFIWSLFVTPVEGRKRPCMRTLLGKVTHLQPLLRWMVERGIRRFADITGHTLDYVPVAKLNINGKPVAAHTACTRLTIVADLYLQRDKLFDALRQDPWPHETAYSLSGNKADAHHRKPLTDPIPDAVAYRLVSAAIDYVQNHATAITEALLAGEAAKAEYIARGYAVTSACNAGADAARVYGFKTFRSLKQEVVRLRTACYILIDMFSGIRDSEMCSLAVGCIGPGRSKDGSTDVLWLHGTIYKTGMRPKRWLVPPIVHEAITVLERLTEPVRALARKELEDLESRAHLAIGRERDRMVKRLTVLRKQRDKLFLAAGPSGAKPPLVLTAMTANTCLKRFCADLKILGDDGRPYPLHPHQFRRTYARFMARSELGDLLTLREHFGHWSIDMTTYYADGGSDDYEADIELLDMIAEERMERQTEIVGNYLTKETPLANGGHWLEDWRSTVHTAANKEELIREYAGTLTLNGTGHSWCVGNAKGTGCGGLCVFEAQMCVDCNFGIIGPEHRPVWEGIRDQQLEALALDDMGPGGRARAQEIFSYAEKVLRRLDGQEAV